MYFKITNVLIQVKNLSSVKSVTNVLPVITTSRLICVYILGKNLTVVHTVTASLSKWPTYAGIYEFIQANDPTNAMHASLHSPIPTN